MKKVKGTRARRIDSTHLPQATAHATFCYTTTKRRAATPNIIIIAKDTLGRISSTGVTNRAHRPVSRISSGKPLHETREGKLQSLVVRQRLRSHHVPQR